MRAVQRPPPWPAVFTPQLGLNALRRGCGALGRQKRQNMGQNRTGSRHAASHIGAAKDQLGRVPPSGPNQRGWKKAAYFKNFLKRPDGRRTFRYIQDAVRRTPPTMFRGGPGIVTTASHRCLICRVPRTNRDRPAGLARQRCPGAQISANHSTQIGIVRDRSRRHDPGRCPRATPSVPASGTQCATVEYRDRLGSQDLDRGDDIGPARDRFAAFRAAGLGPKRRIAPSPATLSGCP